jgi:hypothetical protein
MPFSTNLSNAFRHPRRATRPYFEHETIVVLVLSEVAAGDLLSNLPLDLDKSRIVPVATKTWISIQ